MGKRFPVGLLAATVSAAALALPANAAGKHTHAVLRSSVRALRPPVSSHSHSRPARAQVAWTGAAPIPVPVAETGGGAAFKSVFFVIGGYDASGAVVNDNQMYEESNNTWSTENPIPGNGGGWADAGSCYNPKDHTVHVVNGTDGTFLYAAHQVYNLISHVWSTLSPPNTPADGNFYSQDSGCAFMGGKMYLFGGYGYTDAQGVPQVETLTWVYDMATDVWSDTGFHMNHPRLWMGYTQLTQSVWAAAGTDDFNTFAPLKSTESFSATSGWTATADLPNALLGPGEGIIKSHLLVWGGFDASFIAQDTSYQCNQSPTPCTTWQATTLNLPAAAGFSSWATSAPTRVTSSTMFNAGGYDSSSAVLSNAEHLP